MKNLFLANEKMLTESRKRKGGQTWQEVVLLSDCVAKEGQINYFSFSGLMVQPFIERLSTTIQKINCHGYPTLSSRRERGERERERYIKRKRDKERETDRQRERERERETEKLRERLTDRQKDRDMQSIREIGSETNRQKQTNSKKEEESQSRMK